MPLALWLMAKRLATTNVQFTMIVVLRVQLIRVALWKVSRIWHVAKRLPTTNVQFKIISFTIYYE